MTTMFEYEKNDQVWSVLKRAPRQGLTTKEVAAMLPSAKLNNVRGRLGKLAMYGMIARERFAQPTGGKEFRYRLKD